LEKGTTASDAATRAAVYERVMQETGGNEAEALWRAMEVMNFNRKGSSSLIRIATAALPFFNARLQGLDVFYRASFGQMNTNDAKEIQRRFFVRGMTMMALSVLYFMAVSDDDEYKKQEQETKDNFWIIPSLKVKIPIPFEVGTLFKTIPERIAAYAFKDDTGKDFAAAMFRALNSTLGFNPIPQTFKPIVEAITDYNFYTTRPIIPRGMKDIEAKYQVSPGTSLASEKLANAINALVPNDYEKTLGVSPAKLDHVLKGYTGTIGQYGIDLIGSILEQFGGEGENPRANKRFEQMPIIRRFALDPDAKGTVTGYYDLKNAVDTAVRTSNLLEKTMRPEEFAKYYEDNIGLLAFRGYTNEMYKTLKSLNEMKVFIRSNKEMSGEEKRDALLEISKAENDLTLNIQEVKKQISQLK